MNRKLILFTLAMICSRAAAQSDEVVSLSAFQVSTEADKGYASATPPKPDVAITVLKPATAVVMEVTIVNSADKPEVRNREIYGTIKDIQKAVQAAKGLRFERREIQLRGEARQKSLFSRSSVTSYANVAVVASLGPEADLFALVDTMRSVVSGVTPAGSTKVMDGTVGLYLENPDQYRPELLKKIFDDVAVVKSGLGQDFEVLLSGLDGRVNTRAASEKEVELWIDYSFLIRSLVELKNPRPTR